MAHVIKASEFESKVMQAQGPVMVDFFATWCGPCKMLAPVLDEVAAEVEDKAAVYKVDIDQSPELAQRFGIMSSKTGRSSAPPWARSPSRTSWRFWARLFKSNAKPGS